jgi:carboxypeptidase PM20D1
MVWGRGTLDIKNQLIGIMEAAELLLQQGYRPERTILFGLGHDEETGGVNGCKVIGQILKEKGIHLGGIVDEGVGISAGLAAGVRGPVALIGVSEKGYLTVEFTVNSQPGHSSTPPPQTAIGALARLEAHPMPTPCAGCARSTMALEKRLRYISRLHLPMSGFLDHY